MAWMAVLERVDSGDRFPLAARSLVGRSRACGLRLDASAVSGEHASLRWEQGGWVLRDLGSRNGTWVASRRVAPGEQLRLEAGDELCFAGAERWRLVDAGPPQPCAWAEDDPRALIEGRDGLLALPDADAPVLTIYRDSLGWRLDDDAGVREIRDGERFEFEGRAWLLSLPDALASTAELGEGGQSLALARLRFVVSQDQEHIELSLTHPRGTIELGARSHNLVLLQLARLRLADLAEGLAAGEAGWVYLDALAGQLGVDPPYLNVLVFRARKQLAKLGLLDAATIVERRSGTGQLRIGVGSLDIQSTGP